MKEARGGEKPLTHKDKECIVTSYNQCKQEDNGVKYLKCCEKNYPRILCHAKFSFKTKREINTFSDKIFEGIHC